jgi:hypothetical protein
MAIRALLVGTGQGALLKTLMEKLPTLRDIFVEKDDPRNKPFEDDYFTLLKLFRTFNLSSLKSAVWAAVEVIGVLRHLDYFERDTDAVQKVRNDARCSVVRRESFDNHARV